MENTIKKIFEECAELKNRILHIEEMLIKIQDMKNEEEIKTEDNVENIDEIQKKTLVIVLSETRAHELTFENFKSNVIDVLDADLCVCIGTKPDYDVNNPFFQLAKYRFTYDEPKNFADAFEEAYNEICKDRTKYERMENMNGLSGKISSPKVSEGGVTYYDIDQTDFEEDIVKNSEKYNDEEYVVHTKKFRRKEWSNQVYGSKNNSGNVTLEEDVDTYRKPLYWGEFLNIDDQFLGGIEHNDYPSHPGSGGILIFFRWFLLKNLIKHDLINKYERFVITRSDFIYQLPHPKLSLLDKNYVWIPDCEYYQGYTDRHVILSPEHVEPYLNILNNLVLKSNQYYMRMKICFEDWNLEKLIKFHMDQTKILPKVQPIPYVMYSVRSENGSCRWGHGKYSEEHGYCIKYQSEYVQSSYYKNVFSQYCRDYNNYSIDDFYYGYINGQVQRNYVW